MPDESRPAAPSRVHFGVYDVDLDAGELFKQGRRIRLQGRPFEVLRLLLESPGALITREKLRERLWPDAVFVDFDTNLNTAVARLREALGDSADNPRFIETLPRRGYRFIAEVRTATADVRSRTDALPPATEAGSVLAPDSVIDARVLAGRTRSRPIARAILIAAVVCLGCVALYAMARRNGANVTAADERIRVAVLPFEDLTGDDGRRLADGLTEELITQLGRLAPERLGVIGRASAMRLRGRTQPLRTLGQDLGVRFLVDGSLRVAGSRVRVAVRLSQAADETVLWADVYERELRDGLALQIDIARAVARALAIDVLRNDVKALARATTASTEAFEAYIHGRYELRRGTEASFVAAADAFDRARTADPQFALAHAGWAEAQLVQRRYHLQPPETLFPAALDAAQRAIALDEGIAHAHAVLGAVYQYAAGQSAAAEREMLRALALNPSLASVHEEYAWFLLAARRPDEALRALAKAQDLDPISPSVAAARGYLLLATRHPEQAETEFRRALSIDGLYPFAHYGLGALAQGRGRHDEAIAAFTRAYASGSRAAKYGSALGEAYHRAGRHADALRMLHDLRDLAKRRYVPTDYLDRLASLVERSGT